MSFEFDYEYDQLLHADDFAGGFDQWHHEGVGAIAAAPGGGMRLHCHGSRQGQEGCMAFFRPTLPDSVAWEYDLAVRTHGGLIINYLAMHGLNGEDLIADADKLEPRTGIMANYFSTVWGLQSYHLSISRFNDDGIHTGTCNMRRNPGCFLMAHGMDKVMDLNRWFRIRVIKDQGHVQLFVDGEHVLGFVDRDDRQFPIPDHGKFGFRLIGSDVLADVRDFRVWKIKPNARPFNHNEHYDPRTKN